MSPINNLSSSYIQSALSTALQGTGLRTRTAGNDLSSTGVSPFAVQPDNGQLSPFAQLMSTLQQLQQSDPTRYRQVTQQIAANLQRAAQTAQANGNSTAANQLNQLATDFTNASQSGELPNIQDLAQAIGGHRHHRHHHFHSASADDESNSNTSGSSSGPSRGNLAQALRRFLSALQANGTRNDSTNPMSIILNTLSNAGINGSNGG